MSIKIEVKSLLRKYEIERQILEARYETSLNKLANLSPRLILAWITWIHQSSPHFPHALVDTHEILYHWIIFSFFSNYKTRFHGKYLDWRKDLHSTLRKLFSKNTYTHTHTYILNKSSNCQTKKSLTLILRNFCQRGPKFQFTCMTTFHHIFNAPHVMKM